MLILECVEIYIYIYIYIYIVQEIKLEWATAYSSSCVATRGSVRMIGEQAYAHDRGTAPQGHAWRRPIVTGFLVSLS